MAVLKLPVNSTINKIILISSPVSNEISDRSLVHCLGKLHRSTSQAGLVIPPRAATMSTGDCYSHS